MLNPERPCPGFFPCRRITGTAEYLSRLKKAPARCSIWWRGVRAARQHPMAHGLRGFRHSTARPTANNELLRVTRSQRSRDRALRANGVIANRVGAAELKVSVNRSGTAGGDHELVSGKTVTATQRHRAVEHLMKSRRISDRRACRLVRFSRSAAWYRLQGLEPL